MAEVPFDDLTMDVDGLPLLNGALFSGIATGEDANTKCKFALEYESGYLHGVSREWWPNGTLKEETPYRSGNLHGTVRTWRADGTAESQTHYQYGIKLRETKLRHDGSVEADWMLPQSDARYKQYLAEKQRDEYWQARSKR